MRLEFLRRVLWEKLAGEWSPEGLAALSCEIDLNDVEKTWICCWKVPTKGAPLSGWGPYDTLRRAVESRYGLADTFRLLIRIRGRMRDE